MSSLIKKTYTFLTVVSPTTSLIEDQVFKINSHFRIPSAIMHGGCSYDNGKPIFLEVAQKHVKVLLAISERYVLPSFHRFIRKIHKELGMNLQFAINEGHCLSKECSNAVFRKCCGGIPTIFKDHFNKRPILIVSATIKNDDTADLEHLFI